MCRASVEFIYSTIWYFRGIYAVPHKFHPNSIHFAHHGTDGYFPVSVDRLGQGLPKAHFNVMIHKLRNYKEVISFRLNTLL